MRLTIEAYPGEDIDTCARKAQAVADLLSIPVGFDFNGVKCTADPGGDPFTLGNSYRRELASTHGYKSASS